MVRVTVALSLVLVVPATPPADDQPFWLLAEVLPSPKPTHVSGDGFFTIVEDNPRLKGDVIIDDGRLFFRLSRDRRVLWEKPLPSTRVMIPRDVDRVVMIGKRYGEYGVGPCTNVSEHLWVFDTRGNEIVTLPDTINRTHLFPDGRFVYLTIGAIRLLDLARGGELIWQIDRPTHSFEMLNDGQFLATRNWLQETDESETALYEVESGELVKVLRAPFDFYPWFFAVSSDGQYVFVRTTVQHPRPRPDSPVAKGPLLFDVKLYRIGEWGEPVTVFIAMTDVPVHADRRQADGAVAMLVRKRVPRSSDARATAAHLAHLEIRDAAGKPVFESPLKRGRDDYHRRSVRFERSGSEVRVLFAEMEYLFVRLGGEAP